MSPPLRVSCKIPQCHNSLENPILITAVQIRFQEKVPNRGARISLQINVALNAAQPPSLIYILLTDTLMTSHTLSVSISFFHKLTIHPADWTIA